jgi:hypothetical protein
LVAIPVTKRVTLPKFVAGGVQSKLHVEVAKLAASMSRPEVVLLALVNV